MRAGSSAMMMILSISAGATLGNCEFKWPRALETLASVFTLQQGKIEI